MARIRKATMSGRTRVRPVARAMKTTQRAAAETTRQARTMVFVHGIGNKR